MIVDARSCDESSRLQLEGEAKLSNYELLTDKTYLRLSLHRWTIILFQTGAVMCRDGKRGIIETNSKTWQLRMHCNSRQPDAAQSQSALIRRPCQLWSRSAYPLPSYSVFPADTLCYAVTLNFDPMTLNIHSRLHLPRSNSVRNLSKIGQSVAELLQFEIWPYDLEHVSRDALCSEIGCTKFKLSQAISSWNVTVFWC